MAKRRRLTPPRPDAALVPEGLEPKAIGPSYPLGIAPTVTRQSRAPIADVAGQTAERAALHEVAQAMTEAREEGRLVQRLPLDRIEARHLVRDRLTLNEDEMSALVESLRARGQQTPVEVVELSPEGGQADAAPRYGLISGWRRIEALRRLGADTVLAFVRRPESSAAAYLAMVEENEVRAGLSFYERARVAAEAARLGLFPDPAAAVAALFASASAAKRSKILSFVAVHEALGAALRFPAAIPERLGLALATALAREAAFAPRVADALRKTPPETAAAERALLQRALRKESSEEPAPKGEAVAPGVFLSLRGRAGQGVLTISGPAVDAGLRDALADWLSRR